MANEETVTFNSDEDFGFGLEEVSFNDEVFCIVDLIRKGSQADRAHVKKNWVVSKINEGLCTGKSKADVANALEEEKAVNEKVKLEFWNLFHQDHPYSRHYHFRCENLVVNFVLKDEDSELPCELSYCYGNHENFMIVSTTNDSAHMHDTGLRKGFCLSGIGAHNVFNKAEEDIKTLIKGHTRPVNLAFLTIGHPFHPYTMMRKKMPSVGTWLMEFPDECTETLPIQFEKGKKLDIEFPGTR